MSTENSVRDVPAVPPRTMSQPSPQQGATSRYPGSALPPRLSAGRKAPPVPAGPTKQVAVLTNVPEVGRTTPPSGHPTKGEGGPRRGSSPIQQSPPTGSSPSGEDVAGPTLDDRAKHMSQQQPVQRRSRPPETERDGASPSTQERSSARSTPRVHAAVGTVVGAEAYNGLLVPQDQPAPTMVGDNDDDDGEARDTSRTYKTDEFRNIKNFAMSKRSAPDFIRTFADILWARVPDSEKKLLGSSRDTSMFAEVTVRPERKLYNQVMGILARVTPENFEKMKTDLVSLPIRQSSEREIIDVVNTIYQKATRPEDAPFVELYMKLVVELVNATGSTGTGKMIRKAIIECCQKQFERPFELGESDLIDESGKALNSEEVEYKKMLLKEKLKANVKFLGQLFVNKLISEKVVNCVLFELMYGKNEANRRRRHKPEDYQIELFCELFRKVGPHFSVEITKGTYIKNYVDAMKQLSKSHHAPRIQFMLQDVIELYNNGWVDRRAGQAKPMSLDELARQQMLAQMEGPIPRQRPVHILARSTQPEEEEEEAPPMPTLTQFMVVMEEYCSNDSQLDQLLALFQCLPDSAVRVKYIQVWLQRVVVTIKCHKERDIVGPFLLALVSNGVIERPVIDQILRQFADEIAREETYMEHPRLFANWATMIYRDQTGALPMDLHTMFLRHLMSHRASYQEIRNFIHAVNDASAGKIFSVTVNEREQPRRFRILPALLTYVPVTSSEDAEHEDCCIYDDDGDILDQLRDLQDPEIGAFLLMCTRGTSRELTQLMSQNAHRSEIGLSMKIASAMFTFVRFDVRELDKYKEWFASALKLGNHNEKDFWLAVLIEVHSTWIEFGCFPEDSFFLFVQALQRLHVHKEALMAFQTYLSKFFGSEGAEWARRLD